MSERSLTFVERIVASPLPKGAGWGAAPNISGAPIRRRAPSATGVALNTRARIARTALALFVEKGVAETTIRDIAVGSATAEGTLYRHYDGKEDMAWELFSTSMARYATDLRDLCRAHESLRDQLEAMIRGSCAFFDDDPTLFSYLLLVPYRTSRRYGRQRPHPFRVMRDAITEGMKRNEIPQADPTLATSMVFGLVRETAVSKAAGRLQGSLSGHAGALVAASWRVLAG